MSLTKTNFSIDELEDNFSDLKNDISAIDIKLSDLDQMILDLKNTINRTQTALRAATTPSDRGGLYKIINATSETLATYYQIYQRFLEVKYRYRKEQDDLTFKTASFIQIDLKKIESSADASYYDVMDMFKKIATMEKSENRPSQLPENIQSALTELDDDDNYNMG